MNRRQFISRTALAGMGLTFIPGIVSSFPSIITDRRVIPSTKQGELIFKPVFNQKGTGPHLLDWAYASDTKWDSFLSDITATKEGVKVSDTFGQEKFGVDVRWNVEGFGYIFITADNGGEFYQLPPSGKSLQLNLNYELAKSRVIRNRKRASGHSSKGWKPERDTQKFIDLSEDYLNDAAKVLSDTEKCGLFSQAALYYAMWASEKIELGYADYAINNNGYRPGFYIGCDARGYFQMDPDLFMEGFTKLFNYATITHYLKSASYQDFEPEEGNHVFNLRTALLKELRKKNITVEGRPLFWFYRTVTPDWLRHKPYDDLKRYVEKHVREVVSHYENEMYAWEVVNEAHDWANELQLKPDQITEITRFACDVVKDVNPKVHRLINNCCPYAEYVQLKKWGELDAKYEQRTPHEFMQDLVDAGVDFTITGQQMYFPYRDLADTIILVERLEKFGRPVQLTEVGATSGPSRDSVFTGRLDLPNEPYIWHRPWDYELQADWLEGLYSLCYSKPWIEAVNWYDYVDPFAWIKNGGLIVSPQGEKKPAYDRLLKLQDKWKNLPKK